MHPTRPKKSSVDEYISLFDSNLQSRLKTLRKLFQKLLPQASESISYAIPTYKLGKKVVYFAGYDKHISIYIPPISQLKTTFAKQLKDYKTTKSAIHFANENDLPIEFITELVKYYFELE